MVPKRIDSPTLERPLAPETPVTYTAIATLLLHEADALQWHVPHFRALNVAQVRAARIAELRRVALAVAHGLVVPDAPEVPEAPAVPAVSAVTGDRSPLPEDVSEDPFARLRIHLNALALTFRETAVPAHAPAHASAPASVPARPVRSPR